MSRYNMEDELRRQVAELTAENARLRAELDMALHRKVLLCPASALDDAMSVSLDEEPGTILRSTDQRAIEFEMGEDRQWHPR